MSLIEFYSNIFAPHIDKEALPVLVFLSVADIMYQFENTHY